jgi:uncharacterized delta-60 repeat protein
MMNPSDSPFVDLLDFAIQPDGRIVAVGAFYFFCCIGPASHSNIVLIRLLSDGSLDDSFGSGGIATTPLSVDRFDEARTVALQQDGKIILAGTSGPRSNTDFAILRFNANGTLDASFANAGWLIVPMGSGNDVANSVAIQPDGKIVAAGNVQIGANIYTIGAIRTDANGHLDSSFDGDGKLTVSIGGLNDRANKVLLDPVSRILIGGSSYSPVHSNWDFALARLNPDGSFDNSFGGLGMVTTNLAGSDELASNITLKRDGRIIAVGGAGASFALARYNGNGSLDSSFGGGGIAFSHFGSMNNANSIALQPDGKILVGGSDSWSGTPYILIVRYYDSPSQKAPADFDDDGKTDVSIFRPSEGEWYIRLSGGGFQNTLWQ